MRAVYPESMIPISTRITAMITLAIAALPFAARPSPPHREPTNVTWAAFVKSPSPETYRQLEEMIDACTDDSCEGAVSPDSAAIYPLISLIEHDQPLAIDAAFLSYRLLDGGALEDVARCLGELADRDPRIFLLSVKKHRLAPGAIGTIVRMLPEDVIDHDDRRRQANERRIRSLSSVGDPQVARERAAALAALGASVR